MRRSCIVLLLAASIVAVSAKPSFEDWLAGPKAGISGAAKPSDEYYGEVETVDACLRVTKRSGCAGSSFPSFPPTSYRYSLACCDAKHYGDYSKELTNYLDKPVEVGQCQFHELPIAEEKVSDQITKKATFLAQCSLNDKSDACGHPFCDKQVMTIMGSKYEIKGAIVSSVPEKPVFESPCTSLMSVAQPAYGEYDHKGYEQHKFYKVTSATLFHGTMTINSRMHSIKYEDGTFQFVSYINVPEVPVEATQAEVKEAYVLDPYKIELSYFKPKGY